MSIFGLRDPDCTFIHIPKTGGTSIRKGVWGKRYGRAHHGAVPDHLRDRFSFAFVRHPLDRFVSVWKMFAEGARGDDDWRPPADARPIGIEECFEIVSDEGIVYDHRRSTFEEKIRHHGIPQTHPFNCLSDAAFVGRFETIDADFARLADRLGIEAALPRLHVTRRRTWQEEIPPALLAPLRAYYAEDFARLGYD